MKKYNLLVITYLYLFQTKTQTDKPVQIKTRKSMTIVTEESAVTSTTSDDSEKEDNLPLPEQLKTDKPDVDIPLSKRTKKNKKPALNTTSDDEIDFRVSNSVSSSEVQDENLVSSATPCGQDETKRKRSAKRSDQNRKKLRLSIRDNNKRKSTAISNLNYKQFDDR